MSEITVQALDALAIDQIESKGKVLAKTATESMAELIAILFYLQRTNRYKENKAYQNETFERYVLDVYGMPPGRYELTRRAIHMLPAECEKYGVGVVASAVGRVGVGGTKVALYDLPENPVAADMHKAITDYASRRKSRKRKNNGSQPAPSLNPEADKWRAEYQSLLALYKEQGEQLERAKKTIADLKAELAGKI